MHRFCLSRLIGSPRRHQLLGSALLGAGLLAALLLLLVAAEPNIVRAQDDKEAYI
jgi:hypothetical protein